jgi:hypothetical protein
MCVLPLSNLTCVANLLAEEVGGSLISNNIYQNYAGETFV